MNASWNLPPGCTPGDVDGLPDERTLLQRLNDFIREHCEVPDTDEVRHYVLMRMAREDDPDADEVLAWVERQANLTRVYGTSQRIDVQACPPPVELYAGCPGCGHNPCDCAPASWAIDAAPHH